MNAEDLAATFAAAGLPCEIEAGAVGLVIYAASCAEARRIAYAIANQARARDPLARMEEDPRRDVDEPAATSWWVGVKLDWSRF